MSDTDDEFHDAIERQRDEENGSGDSSGAASENDTQSEDRYGKFQFGRTGANGDTASDRTNGTGHEKVDPEQADTDDAGDSTSETTDSGEKSTTGTDWQELGRRWHERAYENIEQEGERELEVLVADIVSEQSNLLEMIHEWEQSRESCAAVEEQLTVVGGRLYQLQWTLEWKAQRRD